MSKIWWLTDWLTVTHTLTNNQLLNPSCTCRQWGNNMCLGIYLNIPFSSHTRRQWYRCSDIMPKQKGTKAHQKACDLCCDPLEDGQEVLACEGGRNTNVHRCCAGVTESFKAKVRYQQKELDIGKTNVGIKLQILCTKVMTAISLSWNLCDTYSKKNDASRSLVLLKITGISSTVSVPAHESNRVTKLYTNWTVHLYFDIYISTHITKYNHVIVIL